MKKRKFLAGFAGAILGVVFGLGAALAPEAAPNVAVQKCQAKARAVHAELIYDNIRFGGVDFGSAQAH